MAFAFIKIVLLVVGVAVAQVACNVQVKTLDITNNPNDFIGDITSEIKPQGDDSAISATVPIKKELDENLQMKINLKFAGVPLLVDHVVTVCESITDDGIFKPVVDKIEPAGQFPSKCPIPAGEFKVKDYVIDLTDFLPFGLTPSGDFEASVDIGMPDADPIVKVAVTGTVSGKESPLGTLLKLG